MLLYRSCTRVDLFGRAYCTRSPRLLLLGRYTHILDPAFASLCSEQGNVYADFWSNARLNGNSARDSACIVSRKYTEKDVGSYFFWTFADRRIYVVSSVFRCRCAIFVLCGMRCGERYPICDLQKISATLSSGRSYYGSLFRLDALFLNGELLYIRS